MKIQHISTKPYAKKQPQRQNFKGIHAIQTFHPNATLYAADIYNVFSRMLPESFCKKEPRNGLFIFDCPENLKNIETALLESIKDIKANFEDYAKHEAVKNERETVADVAKRLGKKQNPIGFTFPAKVPETLK
jgi:hypothetical protein